MTDKDNEVLAQKLTKAERVVLEINLPGYTYYRCATHGVVAFPSMKGTHRCPNSGCTAHIAMIGNPVTYAASH